MPAAKPNVCRFIAEDLNGGRAPVDADWVFRLLRGRLPGALADDVRAALPAAGHAESGPRRTVRHGVRPRGRVARGDSATFLSCLHVGSDGLIARYVAQMCVPEAFPRAGGARAATRSGCP
jgi:hypothetical protein